jgi:hypothetical protein
LNYTVHVKPLKESKHLRFRPQAQTESIDKHNCYIYLQPKASGSVITHEIVHALQFIARARGINFEDELEHFGYIAQYLFMKIVGGVWDNR